LKRKTDIENGKIPCTSKTDLGRKTENEILCSPPRVNGKCAHLWQQVSHLLESGQWSDSAETDSLVTFYEDDVLFFFLSGVYRICRTLREEHVVFVDEKV
jgi:hypothetical protein